MGVSDVTSDDVLRHEIVQQLCLHPLPHSELIKALPEDPYKDTSIDTIVTQVADFKLVYYRPQSLQLIIAHSYRL